MNPAGVGYCGSEIPILPNPNTNPTYLVSRMTTMTNIKSELSPSRIPDPNCLHPGSRIRTVSIPDPGSSKNLSILTPKKAKKWVLSSKKYDPGCSSRIPDPDADFLPSRIQGSKRHPIPCPGSGSATLMATVKKKKKPFDSR